MALDIEAGRVLLVALLAIGSGRPTAAAVLEPLRLDEDMDRRVNHGTADLPASHRYYLTAKGIAEAADAWASTSRRTSCGFTPCPSSG